LGVCNGCQMLSTLKEIIPGSEHWPKFKDNVSERFEARLVSVEIKKTPSIFFKGMEGSILPIPVAHGEGKAEFTNNSILAQTLSGNLIPLQYVDNGGKVTEQYPLNPNGSKFGVASLTTTDGRATILMPHPERAFLTNQFSWHPEGWKDEGPWLQMFRNARAWVGEK
jgi:phosphoribosylformylglycinamidine synthase